MLKLLFSVWISLLTINGYAQRERVYLGLDKYTCSAGDTIWFKGVIFKGAYPSSLSTNICVELLTGSGIPLRRHIFPILHGQSMGQLILPDSLPTDNYYIVALTRQQLDYDSSDFFSVPVWVYNSERPNSRSHKKAIAQPDQMVAGAIKGLVWVTAVYNGELSSLLALDSAKAPRRLHIVYPVAQDSALRADITLNDWRPQQYALFPVDTGQENASLWLYEDSILIARQFIHLKDDLKTGIPTLNFRADTLDLHADTLDTAPFGYNSWECSLPDSLSFFSSVSVTDADRSTPPPISIEDLHDSYTDNFTVLETAADTSYITFSGKATRQSGKDIKDYFSREIVVAGVKDSAYLFWKVCPIDEKGNFRLDSLFFFDSLALRFQINKQDDGRTKDLKLTLRPPAWPVIDSGLFVSTWEEDPAAMTNADTAMINADSLYTLTEREAQNLSRMKMLPPAIVKGWKNPRKELDDRYTSGSFSEPALYAYDLRNYTSEYNRNIFQYLESRGGRLWYNPARNAMEDPLGHPVHYFVDENEFDSEELGMIDFDRIAYIKILESDFLVSDKPTFSLSAAQPSGEALAIPVQQTPINVLIYTRKGKDFRSMRGGMNTMKVKGYDRILPFLPDRTTLYWNPTLYGNTFRIRFRNSQTAKRFRLVVEGFNPAGKLVHFEKVLPL